MSRVDSPFHAIAAEALDDTPDIPEVVANGSAAGTVATSLDAKGQERESVKLALESAAENGGNDAAGKDESAEREPEQTPVRQERKVSFEVGAEVSETVTKKSRKRTNVWTKTTSRKSAKKVKNSGFRQSDSKDDNVSLKPFHQEDDPSYPILLSKIYKAEKIDLGADRLTASGSKGYRMVRATRGVVEGAWYFEIYVDRLGDTGHTRLGWSTRRGDLQAPVGYDAYSYSYTDLNGCKVHAALREEYGDAYHEKDVLGFYINLPREPGFARKPEEEIVGYKGQPYTVIADEPVEPLPGSEILFFKNGVCQGVAFKDVNDGTYFPAASMYTLPSQDCCKVVFNFGPDFRYPVTDLGDRPLPSPMCQVSGPGEARMEIVLTTQTEAVVDSMVNGGGKWLAPGHGNVMEVEGAAEPTKEENASKEGEEIPPVAKKKVKKSKAPVGNHILQPSSKTSKSGGFQRHLESRREANLKSLKNDAIRLGVGSIGMPCQKGAKKDTAGIGVPNPVGIQTDTGLLDLNFKGVQKGRGKLNLKGCQKDEGPSLRGSKKVLSVTETPNSKGIKQDMSVLGTSTVKGTGLQGLKGNQKDFQESKKGLTEAGLQSSKGCKREISGSGLSKPQKIKKDSIPTGSVFKMSKDLPGTGLAFKASKKDLLATGSGLRASRKDLHGTGPALKPSKKGVLGIGGIGSVLKPSKKDLPGTGSVQKLSKKDVSESGHHPRRLGSLPFSGGKSWGDGIRGATLDVDVVVVESSAPTQAEGPFR